jgi:hypothetical protein
MYDTEVASGGGKLKQVDREQSLQALMTVNLLKRLESSVESFRLTLQSLQSNHQKALDKIATFKKSGAASDLYRSGLRFEDADFDDESLETLMTNCRQANSTIGKVQIDLEDMDLPSWEHDLQAQTWRH